MQNKISAFEPGNHIIISIGLYKLINSLLNIQIDV